MEYVRVQEMVSDALDCHRQSVEEMRCPGKHEDYPKYSYK